MGLDPETRPLRNLWLMIHVFMTRADEGSQVLYLHHCTSLNSPKKSGGTTMAIKVGDKAPAFTLVDGDKKPHALS